MIRKFKILVKYYVISLISVLWANIALADVNCSVSPPSFTFPNYFVANSSPTTLNATLPVTCTTNASGADNVSYTVAFSAGSSGNISSRVMKKGSTNMNYNIFKNATYTQILGNGTTGQLITNSYSFTTSRVDKYTIYGRIPALQNLSVGTYTDTIAITVNW